MPTEARGDLKRKEVPTKAQDIVIKILKRKKIIKFKKRS